MSRVTRWKLEKTKVKVVFRLQFHATHIPQSGWDKLHLSFIPVDSGKATAKTTKANVRNGSCKWSDPVYETTRLLQDSKTKRYEDKLYKLVIAMGSSRSSVLGEATINLADYADASKPAVVQLPLQGPDLGAVLHVTVQLLTSKTGFREFEQQREISERGLQGTVDQDGLKNISGDIVTSHIEKVTSRPKFKSESKLLPSLEEETGLNEDYADLGTGFDVSSNTSGSVCAEKHDIPGSRDVDSIKSTMSGDLSGLSYNQPTPEKGGIPNSCFIPEGTREWVQYYDSGILADNDFADSNLKKIAESDERSIHKIQMEINTLETHHAAISIEVQKLTDQLSSEFSSTNELVKDVNLLKSECSKFRDDIQRLTNIKLNPPLSRVERSSSNPILVKGLQITEDKIKELLNKAFIGFHEKDYNFLIPDLESLCSFLLDLKLETNTLVPSLDKLPGTEADLANVSSLALPKIIDNGMTSEFGMDVCHPEGLLSMNITGLASQETDPTMAMQGEIFKLLRELDESKAQKDTLAKKMDQMECYYEALIHELEETQKQMIAELQSLRNEHSTCIYTISTTKAQMEAMHQEMSNQLLQLAEDRLGLESRNKELERRVLTSEAALKRARLNYSIAVDQLQKDLEVLSLQVLSMYETNETLIKKAFSEASEPCFGGCREETLQSETFDAEISFNPDVAVLCQTQKGGARNGDKILSKDIKKSLDSQEQLYQKIEDEILQMNLTIICLDISVKFLQETLRESRCVVLLKDQRIYELSEQLETTRKSSESLFLKLQIMEENIDALTKDKAVCVSKANEISLLNQNLEVEIRCLTEERGTSAQKIADLEALVTDYVSYKSRYEACDADKLDLTKTVKELMAKNGSLVIKIAEYEALVAEYEGYKSKYEACSADKMGLTSKIEELTAENGNLVSKIAECDALLAEYSEYKTRYEAGNADIMALTSQLERLTAEKGNLENKSAEHEALAAEYLGYKSRYEACNADKMSQTRQLENFTVENGNLMNKVAECEALVAEYSCYKVRYEACDADKMALSNQLEELAAENGTLVNKITECEAQMEHYSSYKSKCEASDADKTSLTRSLEASAAENGSLIKKIAEYEALAEECSIYKSKFEACVAEKTALTNLVDDSNAESSSLMNKISLLEEELTRRRGEFDELAVSKENLQKIVSYLHERLQGLVATPGHESDENSLSNTEMDFEKFAGIISAIEEHHTNASERVIQLMKEKKDVEEEHDMASFSEAEATRQKFKGEIYNVMRKINSSNAGMGRLQAKVDNVCDKLKLCSEVEGRCLEMEQELFSDFGRIETEVQELTSKNGVLSQLLFALGEISEELCREKLTVEELSQDKESLTVSLHSKSNEIIMLESELSSLKETLTGLRSELSIETDSKERLRNELSDITAQLNDKTENLLSFKLQEVEFVQLRNRVLDLESEKAHIQQELLNVKNRLRDSNAESSLIVNLEASLVDLHEQLVSSDVAQVFIRSQWKCHIEKLADLLNLYEKQVKELENKNLDLETSLSQSIAHAADYRKEITKLLSELESLRSEVESYASENEAIKESNHAMAAEMEKYKNHAVSLERTYSDDNIAQALRAQQLHNSLSSCMKEIDDIMLAKGELEIMCLVLQANKLDGHSALKVLLEEYDNDQIMLKEQLDELNAKLSEQSLKTEEFKNLSIHLKELKDKAESELLQSREKEDDGPSSFTSQESLRIVFIKEQYETKIQELKQQLSISKKHGEEILWKLQDALNDIENRRKSEASHMNKNEELSLKILELEDQLQSVLSDNREKMNAYDHIKAELECSLISLECCKEEKQKLLASYEECNSEKTNIAREVELLRNTIESSMATKSSPVMTVSRSVDQSLRDNGGTVPYTDQRHIRVAGDADSMNDIPGIDTDLCVKDLTAEHGKEVNELMEKDAMKSEGAQEAQVQNLKSSMDLVNKVLERMKHENSILSEDVDFEPYVGGLHRELIQLEKVNEELKNMSPEFNGFSGYGNSVERVLALVMELAETLQAKKRSTMQFQSSFLKQHNDEAAVFRSFKDINDLIKDMLELKGKHNAVEMELTEMHERYSQLSLQFAEVEGERQKLQMTLKNVRSPKKILLRSSSASIDEST